MKQLTKYSFVVLLLAIIGFYSCSKEMSLENGFAAGGIAHGTLRDSSGNCQNIGINGTYAVDTILTDSNYILVNAILTSPGSYKIYTDTVNGFWFRDSGYVITAGLHTFKLKGYGKPILPINPTFTVKFDSSFCMFTVTIGSSIPATADYFPTTTNSNWTYFDSYANDTLRITASSLNGIISGNAYRVFVSSQQDTFLYRKDGVGNYYNFTSLDGTSAPVEYIFLKDNVAQGTTWESPEVSTTISGIPTTLKYKMTLSGKNISVTINGTTITNVMKVQEDVMYKVAGVYQIGLTGYYYYAKGIGWIDYEIPALSPSYSFVAQRWQVY
jgi:hypothetical protein